MGSIYWQIGDDQASIQDRIGALFFMATNQAFGMLGSLTIFLEERNLINRERAGGAYRTSSYFFAKTFVEAPFFLLFPLVFSCVAYWMVGFVPTAAAFGIFVGNLVLFAAVSGSMFLAIGAVSPNTTVAQILSPVLTVLFLLFGGFYVNAVRRCSRASQSLSLSLSLSLVHSTLTLTTPTGLTLIQPCRIAFHRTTNGSRTFRSSSTASRPWSTTSSIR